ncbi:hypothetical protein P7K49_014880, partial [Saguinus oedipus]
PKEDTSGHTPQGEQRWDVPESLMSQRACPKSNGQNMNLGLGTDPGLAYATANHLPPKLLSPLCRELKH